MSKQLLDFPTVRQAHGISRDQIAEASNVRPLHEYLFEQGRPIDSAMQGRIVHALSLLCGHHYSLTDFQQCVRPPTQEKGRR
ncbi:MAG TPA: hypothetical protein VEL31_01355 [Ktedonobacteraceae bacterium]|nr:hypothetical protein [Ktedonobacteraceae bacterium]